MSDEQNKDSLLVDQEDALGFYFDSLLLPDDNDLVENGSLKNNSARQEKSDRTTKTITAAPLSPKPGPEESDLHNKPMNTGSTIVFSKKYDDGKISEQVLIPRSQRLAAAKEPFFKTAPLEKKNTSIKQQSAASREAPSLDLSLFLPKIKTLSEEEISQQIEALTQAAVSQAQLESDLAHVAELEQVSQKTLKTQAAADSDGLIRNIDNAPAWAVPDFQVLLFTVAGLKLAVPLTELHGIVEWGDEYITELPGHKSWYLGIIQNQGKSVPVIDTLQQVVPENRWPENYLSERKFKHIIMIDNAHWGLACETVLEVITLKTDAVKWRSSRTRRRWLLGTVIEHMCALLDSAEFAAMLKTGDDSLLSS